MASRDDAYDTLNRVAFENYDDFDPDQNTFDPDINTYEEFVAHKRRQNHAAGSMVRQSPSRREVGGKLPDAQFDILITSRIATDKNIELFNSQSSISKFLNLTNYPTIHPLEAAQAFSFRNSAGTGVALFTGYGAMVQNAGAGTANTCYWAENGDLIFDYQVGADIGTVIISCKQIPYRSLVAYAERGAFRIKKMRMKFTTANQINNDISWQSKTFLGATQTNTVSVSSYFRPDQYQGLLVDVPVPLRIDAEKGLFYQINANEAVLINMFVSDYTRSAI